MKWDKWGLIPGNQAPPPKHKSLHDLSTRVNLEVTIEVVHHAGLWVDRSLHLHLHMCKVIHSSLKLSDPFYRVLSLVNPCDRTTSGSGSSTRISLSNSQWSESTINTHKYNTIYWSSSRSYYNIGWRISYTEEVWSQNYASEDKSEFVEAISLNGQNILFALKENSIHQCSKPEDPSTESNPHRFGLPTDNPHRHRRKEEAPPHLPQEKPQDQSLSHYAQQDLSMVTKR
jgi:hypothetical protein